MPSQPLWTGAIIGPIEKSHRVNDFDCGEPVLNEYLRRYAMKNHKKGVAKAYMGTAEVSKTVVGYYTLSAGAISFQNLPSESSPGLPKYPVPVARLGKLAVAIDRQGTGLGTYLISDAMNRVLMAAEKIGVFALIVDAKHDRAKGFYKRFGFLEFQDTSLSLFLPVATIAAAT